MLILHDPLRQTDLPRGCIATVGNFDGMHIGHQAIIGGVVERARETGRPSAVITFHSHPLAIVAPDPVPEQIPTLPQKEELIRQMGVDALLVVPFTHEFSRWTADRFIEEFLVGALQVAEVRIGRGIARGAMRAVALALGRTYFIDGIVATGRRLGRKIGFPTVNVDPFNELYPDGGVFVTTSRFESFDRSFESVTNIGVRPTLYENYAITIESHILDFDSNVYGDTVRLYFHQLLRREQQFRSAVELTRQIRDDIERSRRYFLRSGHRSQVTGDR